MTHARARALARRRLPPSNWLGPLLATALVLLALRAMAADPPPPAPLPPKTGETGPTTMPPASTDQLNRGVIRPPAAVDPGMNRGTPNAQVFPTPVVPPPGTAGGNPRVTPK